MLKVGDKAPDFTALLGSGEQLTLAQFRGKNVVLYFYPRAFSPGCSIQTRGFRDAYDNFIAQNAVVIGIGPDDADTTRRFSESCAAPHYMASDASGEARKRYDVARRFKLGTSRVTYVIDARGVIRGAFHNEIAMGRHVSRALQALAALD